MNGTFRTTAVAATCGFALAIATQIFAQQTMHKMGGASPHMEPGAMQMHQMMMASAKSMMDMKMPMEKNTDKMFALGMAMHHNDAIKMARIELKYGRNAQLKAIAKNILASQTAEKAKLEKIAKTIR